MALGRRLTFVFAIAIFSIQYKNSCQFSIGDIGSSIKSGLSSGANVITSGLSAGANELTSDLSTGANFLKSGLNSSAHVLAAGAGALESEVEKDVGKLASGVETGAGVIGTGLAKGGQALVDTATVGASLLTHGLQQVGGITLNLTSKVGEGILDLKDQSRSIVSILGAPAHLSWDPNDVHFFWYYNAKNLTERKEIKYKDLSSLEEFLKNRPLIMISHGFRENTLGEDVSSVEIKDAYLQAGYADKSNIVLVDWGRMSGISPIKIVLAEVLALLPVYIGAVSDVYVVAQRVADFLGFLIENEIINGGKDVHLVGHSLGGQVSGMAGHYFKSVVPGDSISRITGSDPAGPLFQFIPKNYRLDPSDADFVDVVHTNQGVFGYILQTGQADFFLNGGGPLQPNCAKWSDPIGCSHSLAPRYFAKSILNKDMVGTCRKPGTCEPGDTVTFGEFAQPGTKGSFEVDRSLYE